MENRRTNFYNQRPVMSVGSWLVTLILMWIPIVNIILLFVWGFGSDTPQEKKNWAKAQLVIILIQILLSVLTAVVFGSWIVAFLAGYAAY